MTVFFCSHAYPHQDFHIIVSWYCKSVVIQQLIEQEEYVVIHSGDNQIIWYSEFPNMIWSGMTVQCSFTLWEIGELPHYERKCPCCSHIHVYVIAGGDWIEYSCRQAKPACLLVPEENSFGTKWTSYSDSDRIFPWVFGSSQILRQKNDLIAFIHPL